MPVLILGVFIALFGVISYAVVAVLDRRALAAKGGSARPVASAPPQIGELVQNPPDLARR